MLKLAKPLNYPHCVVLHPDMLEVSWSCKPPCKPPNACAQSTRSHTEQGDDAQKAAAAEVLCVVLETVRVAAVALYPLTPALSQRCFAQLGLPDSYAKVRTCTCTYRKPTQLPCMVPGADLDVHSNSSALL